MVSICDSVGFGEILPVHAEFPGNDVKRITGLTRVQGRYWSAAVAAPAQPPRRGLSAPDPQRFVWGQRCYWQLPMPRRLCRSVTRCGTVFRRALRCAFVPEPVLGQPMKEEV